MPYRSLAKQSILPYLTPDREFVDVQSPAWVKEGVVKVFLSLDDQASIAEAAAIGATIVHAGGPALYYPLRRDDPQSGIPEPERSQLL